MSAVPYQRKIFILGFILVCCGLAVYHITNTIVDNMAVLDDITDDSKITYSVTELRKEMGYIHDSNYQIKDGDTCTKAFPDCMIVGVAKSGTTELLDFMSVHPNIVSIPEQIKSEVFYSHTAYSFIKNKMPCKYSDQVIALKADSFLNNVNMPKRLFGLNPNMKIIAIIREPVSRLKSWITFLRDLSKNNNGYISKINELDQFIEYISKPGTNMTQSKLPGAVNISVYDKGVARYFKQFQKENVLVIESDEFKRDPVGVIGKVEQLLGIRRFVSNEHFSFNSQKGFYCIHKAFKPPKDMVCYNKNRGRNTSIDLNTEAIKKLRTFFEPHNENLFQLLGKKYDW